MSDSQETANMQKEKSSRVVHATEFLLEIAQRPIQHIQLSPGVITPYDAYSVFIETVKKTIPPEIIHHLQPNSEPNLPVEKVLTPSFVCSLAMSHLRKLLGVVDEE